MGQNINNNFKVNAPKHIDTRYGKSVANVSTPYSSVSEANSLIDSSYRFIGLTVNVGGVEYWYGSGLDDTDLVVKSTSSQGDFIVSQMLNLSN